jgi:putative NIF3 family GTP cyclohydrolase 1 type 2
VNCVAGDVLQSVREWTGGRLNADEGLIAGDGDRPVRHALGCWMATVDALRQAERELADLVIAHESVFYPYNARPVSGETQEWEDWQTNRGRLEVIRRAGLSVVRIHGSADLICIRDEFAERLELGQPVLGEGLHTLFRIEPTPLKALVEHVTRRVGLDHVRVSCRDGDFDRTVRVVGLPWGGLGLDSNVAYQQWCIENGCDVLIAGESDSYGFRFSGECGIPMIETSHEASEVPGMRRFIDLLQTKHPDVTFTFYAQGTPWRWM